MAGGNVGRGGAVALKASGQAACSTSALKVPGSPHTITAEYSGATNFLASSGTLGGTATIALGSRIRTTNGGGTYTLGNGFAVTGGLP